MNDVQIREALKRFLHAKSNKPRMLIEELRIHNGNSIADVVGIYSFMHGYEIKGEKDKVSRLQRQSHYYSKTFPAVTLVTTSNHLSWALANLPSCWGLLIAEKNSAADIVFKYARKAGHNRDFSQNLALSMLWKDELTNLAKKYLVPLNQKDSREAIANKLAPILKKRDTAAHLAEIIFERYKSSSTI
ncbi:sce7726 family protein [Herbaspirillum huttiense]|uniref:Sce7726 family protein n=2 Tax=Herbaspirillum huttiense TaxID=863372 RepID=A0AAJ2HA94_9BURK|nr:sce7726 family protein [Herbaspirillum huttiense]MDR9836410.1 sce7726 family protein [Herbaspirillum huttiense]